MKKELLLAIGDDDAASYNLRFIKDVFGKLCDLKLTLFYVAPRPARWGMSETDLAPSGDHLERLMTYKKTKGEQALAKARQWLKDVAGCSGDNVATKVVHSKMGTARELIEEAHKGMYDALLLGRKGFSWFEGVFEHSVTHEILWRDIDFPIWVCKRPLDNPRHDVLLCMDGSDASLRIVDHAAYMLAEEEQHTFTLFHVSKSGLDPAKTSAIFDPGLKALAEHGIDQERIEIKMATASSAVKATIKEAKDGNYSAVGVGKRSGCCQTKMEEMFPSSFTIRLLRQLESSALWISK